MLFCKRNNDNKEHNNLLIRVSETAHSRHYAEHVVIGGVCMELARRRGVKG
jgi:hypothetical protein